MSGNKNDSGAAIQKESSEGAATTESKQEPMRKGAMPACNIYLWLNYRNYQMV